MSQVLKYGVPVREGLLCSNISCKELANVMFTPPDAPNDEIFACNDHVTGLVNGKHIRRFVKLLVPGERNPKEKTTDGQKGKESRKRNPQ
jgi:hypothetical protein